ncbi:MAG: hypothetical protein ACPG19_15150, partial [Saprospiraceae bacterium]
MKKNSLSLMVFLLLIPFISTGQKYKNIESGGIRIDPEWTQTARTTGFSWGYDVIYDKKGNTYSTGYVRKQIAESATKFGPPPCLKGISCQDVTFLSKRNSKGELIWRQYIYGSTRVLKLVLDKNGYINMVGSIYSRNIALSSTGIEPIILVNEPGYTGIFMCQYNEKGIIQKSKIYNEGKRSTALSFEIDGKDNLYIGGYTQYRSYDKPSSAQSSYLFLKFDNNWNLDWKMSGDTIGQSIIHSITLDRRSNLVFTGMYINDMNLGGKRTSKDYHQKPFIGKMNGRGKVKWISEEISKHGNGVGSDLVCDSKGNAYVTVNTSYSHGFFAKVNKKGKTKWMHKIGRSVTFEDLVITKDDRILLCGEGQGALFPSNGTFLYSYKSLGGTDPFIAEYDTEGVLKWLKAFGSKGTDYCRSMAIKGDKVMAFGSYDYPLVFKNTKLPKRAHFYYAEFSLKKLENTSVKAPARVGKVIPPTTKNIGCVCKQDLKQLSYVPRINDFATYEEVENLAEGWKYAGEKNFYESLYYKKFYNSYDRRSNTASMILVAIKPISFMHPDQTMAINLSPCKSNQSYREVPVTVYYTVPIKENYPGFELEEFGKTTKEYMEILGSYFNLNSYELLYKVLLNSELNDVESFVKDINIRYGWSIKTDLDDEEAFIEAFVKTLDEKDVDSYDFVLNEFVMTEKTEHIITTDEKKRLNEIFTLWRYGDGFDETINDIISPSVGVTFNTKKIGIDINTKIIRRWNNLKNEPLMKANQYIKTDILADVEAVRFETKKGLTAYTSKACMTRSEITGTGILLDFERLNLEMKPINKATFLNGYRRNLSLAANDQKPLTDELLNDFSGL